MLQLISLTSEMKLRENFIIKRTVDAADDDDGGKITRK